MSTSSKPKSRAPAHPNTRAFKHNKNSRLTRRIALVGTDGLCKKCADKIEWRKKYRKYKPLSVPKKCNVCLEKRIKAAYRSLCAACAEAAGKCPGCAESAVEGDGEDEAGAKQRATSSGHDAGGSA
ncbi:unnamed protein product [Chondrus crispus]|uniref:Uncharacterized protein n=1 Tax=Chondrus crispus TaxID=2769 RepID=R7QK83_CHOCR|nr:unnamed protein product [Chondrus crispus]CDF38932.1 unnamed protein product [Chondrus crispus]|eukprot:XP_005718837.1 unnamed protein product [Chondrus crispus]